MLCPIRLRNRLRRTPTPSPSSAPFHAGTGPGRIPPTPFRERTAGTFRFETIRPARYTGRAPLAGHQANYLEDTMAFEAAGPIRLDNFAGYLHEDTHFVDQRDLSADMEREQAG